ncbi:MAG: hypothetical protein FD129_1332 [bacterium]|nr:MAG: hypothetical protein FD129_1332 [bacterium]
MDETRGITDPELREDESQLDSNLRPQRMVDFVGQWSISSASGACARTSGSA